MNTDRIEELGKRIVKSDLWNIGLHGIFVKEVDKINMSETSANITKKVILGLETLAIGVTAWACAKGYIAPTQESNTGNTNNSSEVDPSLNAEQSNQEKLVNYGQFLIGEAKIGKISDLTLQTNPNQEEVDKIKSLAYQIIPETKNKDLSINIYDMVGSEGTAPFVTVSINNKDGNLEFAYVGFSIDENNIQRPPQDGDIQIFYPLRVVEQDDNSNFIGIPDATTKNLQVPVMFFIDTQGNSYFYPPYTDYVAQESNPSGGMKVSAIVFKPEAPVESPLPEGAISELQKTLGENYKLTKAKEGDYFVIDGIDNLKFDEDGTAELVFEDRDLTVDFRTISVKDDALRVEGLQYKDKLWTRITSGAPTEADAKDLDKYIANLPKQVLVLGAPNYEEINRSNRSMDQIVMEKTATYDPLDEFKGIIVDGKELDITDVLNEYEVFGLDNAKYGVTIQSNWDRYYDSTQVALGQGWSRLEVYDADSNILHDLIKVPIVDVTSDNKITVMGGLIDKSELSEILDSLTKEKRNGILFRLIRNVEFPASDARDDALSDDKLRELMAKYNQAFFDQNILIEIMDQLPPELRVMVYFGLWVDHDN